MAVSAFLAAALVPLVATAQLAAPVDLLATAGDEQAVLTWRNPSNPNILRYELRFGVGEAPEFNAWAGVPGSDSDTVEHTVPGLANGTRYAFELRAVDDAGAGWVASAATRLAASPSSIVEVPDASLREQIQWKLGLDGDAPITQGDMAKLREFRAAATPVADLDGLEFAVNLVELGLKGNEVSDVAPLSGLTSLKRLELQYNAITDVAPLSGLTSLHDLNLSNNEFSDISSLSGLTSLTALRLHGNGISDISALSGLTSLSVLGLVGNEIVDVAPLSGLTSLWMLELWRNRIVDVSPLSRLSRLWLLSLGDNQLSDLSPLSGLRSLASLGLSGNEITDVSPLSRLWSLASLDLSGNAISDVSPLSRLTSLRWLRLQHNEIADVSPLAGATSLRRVQLDGNAISDLSSLENLGELSFLVFKANAVTDISPLLESGLPGPGNYVDVRGNPLADGQADHVKALRDLGTAVAFDDGGHRVPLFPSAATGSWVTGFVRVINHSNEAGSVAIEAIDETGRAVGRPCPSPLVKRCTSMPKTWSRATRTRVCAASASRPATGD